jgi:hypothetical protein
MVKTSKCCTLPNWKETLTHKLNKCMPYKDSSWKVYMSMFATLRCYIAPKCSKVSTDHHPWEKTFSMVGCSCISSYGALLKMAYASSIYHNFSWLTCNWVVGFIGPFTRNEPTLLRFIRCCGGRKLGVMKLQEIYNVLGFEGSEFRSLPIQSNLCWAWQHISSCWAINSKLR